MKTDLERVYSRPSGLPLWAWIVDGKVNGVCTFEHHPDEPPDEGYLPVFGDEPPADLDRQYFLDQYQLDGERVIRTRTVHDR